MTTISDYFTALLGAPVWGVRPSHGSAFFLEFGDPYLYIREPRVASPGATMKVRRLGERRIIEPVGTWSLLVDAGYWTLTTRYGEVDCFEKPGDKTRDCYAELSGQYLRSALYHERLDDRDHVLVLAFDLGGKLTIAKPDEPAGTLWSVKHRYSGSVFMDDDGTFGPES